MKRWLVFGNHVLAKSTLSPRDREIAILRIGWLCRAEYEWGQHVLIARALGRDGRGDRADHATARCAGLVGGRRRRCSAQSTSSTRDAFVTDATWAALGERYDVHQLLDLVFTVGQYQLVSMALNTLGVQRDAGVPGFPK